MSLRTTASLALLCLLGIACTVPVPQPPRLTIAIDAKARVQTPPPPAIEVEAQLGAEVSGETLSVEVEPPQPTLPVALEGAAVIEFFGIPLEGAQDIVFVLDRSGSMADLALGQLAELAIVPGPLPPPPLALPPAGEPQAAPVDPQALAAPPTPTEGQWQAEVSPPFQAPRKIDVAHAELTAAILRLPAGTRMNVLFFNNRLEAHQAGISPLEEGERDLVIGFVRETVPYGSTALAPAMRTAFLMNAKRIVLLSDGLGNVGGDAASVLRDAREAMRGGVRIDTIGLGRDQDAWLLETLASESRGIYQQL